MHTSITTIAAILFFIDAFMWLVGMVPTLYYALHHRSWPTLPPIGKLLSGGPFDRLGIDAMIVSGIICIVVSALKIMAAYWLWNARLDGAILGLILLGLSAIFWYGFALPLGPLLGIAEVIALILAWSALQ
jgi:hypothetical protein